MIKLLFTLKQPKVNIVALPNGQYDVTICTNEQEVETGGENSDGDSISATMYQYDGNMFRTVYQLTEEDILADLNKYLDYSTADEPTIQSVQHDNEVIDSYTAQLIDGGLL